MIKNLTKRQIDIMELVAKGLTNIEVSNILQISPNTVKAHLARIYDAIEVKNRTEAVAKIIKIDKEKKSTLKQYFRPPEIFISSSLSGFNAVGTLKNELQKYELFSIVESPDNISDTFNINIAHEKNKDTISCTIISMDNKRILLTKTISISEFSPATDNFKNIICEIYFSLKQYILNQYKSTEDTCSNYWYIVWISEQMLNIRTKEKWELCIQYLNQAENESINNIWVTYGLGILWYAALLESLLPIEQSFQKLCEYTEKANRLDETSQYSSILNMVLSIVKKDYKTAAEYGQTAIKKNPYNLRAYQLLAQAYTLDNNCKKGLNIINRLKNISHYHFDKPSNMATEALLLFFNDDITECKKCLDELLYIIPNFLIPRVLSIAIDGYLNDKEMAKKDIEAFEKYNSSFNLTYFYQLTSGLHPDLIKKLNKGFNKAGFNIEKYTNNKGM